LFENEEIANNTFENISECLNNNGYFIITIPDANILVKRLRETGKERESSNGQMYEIGNDYYSIQFG